MEDRLKEYIHVKYYLRIHKITPNILPEKVYRITQEDLEKIQQYLTVAPRKPYQQVIHYDENIREILELRGIIDKINLYKEKPAYMVGSIKKPQDHMVNPERISRYRLDERALNRERPEYKYYMDRRLNTKKKSFGYDNYYEAGYQYIDNEIQTPEHVVMDFPRGGESTRLNNNINNKYCREIMY